MVWMLITLDGPRETIIPRNTTATPSQKNLHRINTVSDHKAQTGTEGRLGGAWWCLPTACVFVPHFQS